MEHFLLPDTYYAKLKYIIYETPPIKVENYHFHKDELSMNFLM